MSAYIGHPTTETKKSHACQLCQQRKIKCDKNSPCSNCRKSSTECEFVAPQAPQRRKRKLPDEELLAQLQRYEKLLKAHGIPLHSEVEEVETLFTGDSNSSRSRTDASIAPKASTDEASINLKIGKLIVEDGRTRYVEE
jgi:Fungal Zn(2)-Cys(6) binuclear cluster domain